MTLLMKKLKILRIVASSSFAWSFGRMSRDELYHRFDRAAELAGRGPRYFSGHRRDEAV